MVNWGVELSEFDIKYSPRLSIKVQALADFVVKCIVEKSSDEDENRQLIPVDQEDRIWTLYVDGSSAESSSGAG